MNNKIKGYKASYNGVCLGHLYEVGKTYNIDNIVMCERGFHFCVEMKDVIGYYSYNDKFVLFEVIGSGEMITEGNKTVCSQIEIIRIIPKEEYTFLLPIREYDNKGNIIHSKGSDGYEYWNTFDENNNVIHSKNSKDYEYWKTYDENNNVIHSKDSKDYEYWKTYDKKGNLIHFKDSKDYEYLKTYDENNNVIHFKDSKDYEYWKIYDVKNNRIHFKDSTGFEQSY